jgi:hypothetical protein
LLKDAAFAAKTTADFVLSVGAASAPSLLLLFFSCCCCLRVVLFMLL